MILHGKDVTIRNADDDNALVALSTNCELSVSSDTLETATGGKYRTFVAGHCEWSVTISAFISAIGTGIDMMGGTYEIAFTDDASSVAYTGTVLCTDYKVTANVRDLVKGSFAFQGSGPLEQSV